MNLDDGMGSEQPDNPRRPFPKWIWLAAGGVLALVFLTVTIGGGGSAESEPAPAPVPAVTTPAEEGHNHPVSTGATRAAWTSLNTFLNGWTSTNSETRAKVFEQTTIPELAEGLAETIPENVVTAPISDIVVTSASPYSTEFQVWFEKVDVPTWVLLTSGHGGSFDWRVAELEKRPA